MKQLKERIKKHEGFVSRIYEDSLGKKTIGYGHLITPQDHFEEGVDYDQEILEDLFDDDFNVARDQALSIVHNNKLEIHQDAFEVLIEMCFQLGVGNVLKFKKMIKALKNQDYCEASRQMLDSEWNKQTPQRCQELAKIMTNIC